jgi:hypothetical protein
MSANANAHESFSFTLTKPRVFVLLGAVILLWVCVPSFVIAFMAGGWAERGQFGDVFGSVNALFSGLAFTGVIMAILLQREELGLQREELRLSRTELQKSVAAQEETQKALNRTLHAQTFKIAVEFLESERVVAARRELHLRRDLPFDQWKNDEAHRLRVETVLRAYNLAGALVTHGSMPMEYMLNTYGPSIVRFWTILKPFVDQQRAERKNEPRYVHDFEALYEAARGRFT